MKKFKMRNPHSGIRGTDLLDIDLDYSLALVWIDAKCSTRHHWLLKLIINYNRIAVLTNSQY